MSERLRERGEIERGRERERERGRERETARERERERGRDKERELLWRPSRPSLPNFEERAMVKLVSFLISENFNSI